MSIAIKAARVAASIIAVASLSACATSTKVAVQQPGDNNLTCAQITDQYAKLDAVMAEADKNKGVNKANVAAAVFFPIAIVGNYLDADKAQDLVERRRTHLSQIAAKKNCG